MQERKSYGPCVSKERCLEILTEEVQDLVEYDADLDAPFGDMDSITHWQPCPEPYRPASGTDKPDWRDSMIRKFDRRG